MTFVISSFLGFSQGQITGFTLVPASPTTNDPVQVYVHLSFNSGGCDLDNKGSSTTGTTTTAYSLHCVGMLTVICPITDTFDLGYLQAGNHTFNFTLSSGQGGPGCSPGFAPDDTDTFNFTVTQALGMEDPTENHKVSFYPNPMSSSGILKMDASVLTGNPTLEILDAAGRVVWTKTNLTTETLLNEIPFSSGLYFYRIMNEEGIIATEKFVVE